MRATSAAPGLEITVDGTLLTPAAHAAIASVRVSRRLSQPAQCEVAFVAGPAVVAGSQVPFAVPIGARLAVAVTGDQGSLFEGEVTGQEWCHESDGAAELRVRAYDPLHRLRKHQRVVGRTDVTLADLAGELAGIAGIGTKVEAQGPRWPVLVQHRQDDLELLQEVAEGQGLWFGVVDGDLRLFTLEGIGEAVELVLHQNLLAARFDASAEPACRSVQALGWDPVTARGVEAEASDPRSGRDTPARTDPDIVGGDGERFLAGHLAPGPDHLEAAAQAELDRRVAGEVTFFGTALGDARLHPGRPVRVAGTHSSVTGTYVLTRTVHTLDAAGYRTELDTAPPPRSTPAAATTTTLGEVTSADDPDRLGRVRVTLPAFAGVETDWREVVSIGAGAGKGLVALPDTGDRVLVLLPAGDPAAAVVLGGLFGDTAPDDGGLEAGAVKRWSLLTGGGQRVVLDDDKGRIVLANRDGSTIELAPERVTVHAAADLTIEAPGATMTLRANRIELVQATSAEDAPEPSGAA